MKKEDILEKLLQQSQLAGCKALIENSNIEHKNKIVEKLESHYCFTELIWEKHWQESKRSIALEFKIMVREGELKELKKEIEKLKLVIENA